MTTNEPKNIIVFAQIPLLNKPDPHTNVVLGDFLEKSDAFALFDLLRKGNIEMKIDIIDLKTGKILHDEGVSESCYVD